MTEYGKFIGRLNPGDKIINSNYKDHGTLTVKEVEYLQDLHGYYFRIWFIEMEMFDIVDAEKPYPKYIKLVQTANSRTINT